MSSIAIITARGGSKRIPQKNIKEFCGKPIIAYSIEAALNSCIFDEVMVSTDSAEIAEVAKEYGAQIPFMRSDDNSNDYATTADVIEEVLRAYQDKGKVFDTFACIYPTAPFITAEKIREAFQNMIKSEADATLSVVKFSYPPQRAFVIKEGFIKFQYPEHEKSRSQDLEPIYHDCGQFYICDTKKFFSSKTLIQAKTVPYMIPEEEVQDIDTPSDWKIAEAKYEALNRG